MTSTLQIEFYDEHNVAIALQHLGNDDARSEELLVFALFALRQMSNLGSSAPSLSLAQALCTFGAKTYELAAATDVLDPKLVEFRGPAPRRFIATLSPPVKFHLKAKGFGFLARGMGYYAPVSVLTLLRFLCRRHAADAASLSRLGAVAARCGAAFQAGHVSLTNQQTLAESIVSEVAATSTSSQPASSTRASSTSSPTPSASDQDLYRVIADRGQYITRDDLVAILENRAVATFANFDRATQLALDYLARNSSEEFSRVFPEATPSGGDALQLEIGSTMLDGYAFARRILNTHEGRIIFSGDKEDAKQKAIALLDICNRLQPLQPLKDEITNVIGSWAGFTASKGLFADGKNRQQMEETVFVMMLYGLSLAFAEHAMVMMPPPGA
jgi:hypothetical protein